MLRLILQLFDIDEDFNMVDQIKQKRYAILNDVFNNTYHRFRQEYVPLVKKRRLSRRVKPRLTMQTLLRQLNISDEEFKSMQHQNKMESISLYQAFKDNILNHGTLKWRVFSSTNQTVVMNDYDSETGDFKFFDYVIVSMETSSQDNDVVWNCSCETFRVLMSTVQMNFGEITWEGLMCLHCRLLKELQLQHNVRRVDLSSDHAYTREIPNTDAPVSKAIISHNYPVILLPTQHLSNQKYNVVSKDEVQFINVFQSQYNSVIYISCLSGLCQHVFGKKRKYVTLDESEQICEHLKVFRSHKEELANLQELVNSSDNVSDSEDGEIDITDDVEDVNLELEEEIVSEGGLADHLWKNAFDPFTGMWKFNSPFPHTVSQDPFERNLLDNCRQRNLLVASFENDTCMNFFPLCTDELCECQLPWKVDNDGNKVHAFDCVTTLYTLPGLLKAKVFKLVCSTNTCVIRWNGCNECIFRVSSEICAGYEICWEFVEMVTKVKCNFAAYCDIVTSRYQRSNCSSVSFMSAKTFRKLFLTWASNQNVDFRVACSWCGNEPKILAADATKIGVARKNVNIEPVERPHTEQLQRTIHRRFDRCFLTYPSKETVPRLDDRKRVEALIRESRKHLKQIMSSHNGFLCQPSLTAEELANRNRSLLECFPQPCRNLLRRLFHMEMGNDQKIATTKLFRLLSYDSPLRSVIPSAFFPTLAQFLDDVDNRRIPNMTGLLMNSKKFAPVVGTFINSFFLDNSLDNDALSVVRHLFARVKSIYENDALPEEPLVIRCYNPPK